MMYPFQFNAMFPNATNEQLWDQIRLWRQTELMFTDWTQVADSKAEKAAWAEYRQALRDLPLQNADPKKIIFPTRPA